MKPTGTQVAQAAALAVGVGYTYDEMDCQAFIEHCARQAGGRMDYLGTNDMARRAAWLGTLSQARAEGRLTPGAGLLIREETDANLPARYAGDGLGDFSHVGLYVGEGALSDTDKNGRRRACDAVHSSATMGRVAGTTLQNGWTHAMWFSEIDYGEGDGGTGATATPGATATTGATGTGATGNRRDRHPRCDRHRRDRRGNPRAGADGGRGFRRVRHGRPAGRQPGEAAQIGQPGGDALLAGGGGGAGRGGAHAGGVEPDPRGLHRRAHAPGVDDGPVSAEVRA